MNIPPEPSPDQSDYSQKVEERIRAIEEEVSIIVVQSLDAWAALFGDVLSPTARVRQGIVIALSIFCLLVSSGTADVKEITVTPLKIAVTHVEVLVWSARGLLLFFILAFWLASFRDSRLRRILEQKTGMNAREIIDRLDKVVRERYGQIHALAEEIGRRIGDRARIQDVHDREIKDLEISLLSQVENKDDVVASIRRHSQVSERRHMLYNAFARHCEADGVDDLQRLHIKLVTVDQISTDMSVHLKKIRHVLSWHTAERAIEVYAPIVVGIAALAWFVWLRCGS